MITWLEKQWRRLRARLSRSEWAVKTLAYPQSGADSSSPGILLIQIDGLSRVEMDNALATGRLPFLKSLLDREDYSLTSFYPGLPSTTPAVQAELHFGERCAVPAFHFFDRQAGCFRMMYEAANASAVAAKVAGKGPSLVAGGSSYANIYSVKTEQAKFCVQQL